MSSERAQQQPASPMKLQFDKESMRTKITADPDVEHEVGSIHTPRFFIEHGMIHDRVTGKHVTTCPDDEVWNGGTITSTLNLLNELAAKAQPSVLVETREPAPANSLPNWSECSLRVDNSDFIDKRVAAGGYGADRDSKLATELHRFIYEYDDADPYRSAWFMHRLEKLLDFTRETAVAALQQPTVTLRPITDEDARKCLDAYCTVVGMREALEALLPHGVPVEEKRDER